MGLQNTHLIKRVVKITIECELELTEWDAFHKEVGESDLWQALQSYGAQVMFAQAEVPARDTVTVDLT